MLQLVDEGLIDLGEPLAGLPDATPQMLLTHTSGLPWIDGPRRAPGSFSYSDAGYALAGRLIEERRSASWFEVLRERLLEPLQLDSTWAHWRDAPAERLAGAQPPPWGPDEHGPAGATVVATAGDTVRFASAWLEGTLPLSPEAHALMGEPQVDLPNPIIGDAWCLGWALFHRGREQQLGWGGIVPGTRSALRISRQGGTAVVAFGAADAASPLVHAVVDAVVAPPLAPTGPETDARRLAGRYGEGAVVEERVGTLVLTYARLWLDHVTLRRVGGDAFVHGVGTPTESVAFVERGARMYIGPFLLDRVSADAGEPSAT